MVMNKIANIRHLKYINLIVFNNNYELSPRTLAQACNRHHPTSDAPQLPPNRMENQAHTALSLAGGDMTSILCAMPFFLCCGQRVNTIAQQLRQTSSFYVAITRSSYCVHILQPIVDRVLFYHLALRTFIGMLRCVAVAERCNCD